MWESERTKTEWKREKEIYTENNFEAQDFTK